MINKISPSHNYYPWGINFNNSSMFKCDEKKSENEAVEFHEVKIDKITENNDAKKPISEIAKALEEMQEKNDQKPIKPFFNIHKSLSIVSSGKWIELCGSPW